MISESLKINTTLTKLDLGCDIYKDKKKRQEKPKEREIKEEVNQKKERM